MTNTELPNYDATSRAIKAIEEAGGFPLGDGMHLDPSEYWPVFAAAVPVIWDAALDECRRRGHTND